MSQLRLPHGEKWDSGISKHTGQMGYKRALSQHMSVVGPTINEVYKDSLDSFMVNITGEIDHIEAQYLIVNPLLKLIGLLENSQPIPVCDEEGEELYSVDPPEYIMVLINSIGGDASTALAIAHIIETSAVPIHTYCTGHCASGAALILAAGTKRFAMPTSQIMFHGVQYEFPSGPAGEIKENIDKWSLPLDKKVVEFLYRHSKIDKKDLKKFLKTDRVLMASKAKQYGFVDHIIGVPKPRFKKEQRKVMKLDT